MNKDIKFIFFGSSRFSGFVLEELEIAGYSPILNIASAKDDLDIDKLRALDADLFVVASFGKILTKTILDIPKHGSLNVHPSLLPELRGPAPIQNLILGLGTPGVTIIKMDEKMDHGPILAQEKVSITPWPDHYDKVEEKMGRAGGKLLLTPLANIGCWPTTPQDESKATYIKLIKKEDGLLDLEDDAGTNLRKVLAYSTWPGAYFFFKNKMGKEIRVVVKDAKIKDPKPEQDRHGASGKFVPTRIIPEGKKEMDWQDFLRGNA